MVHFSLSRTGRDRSPGVMRDWTSPGPPAEWAAQLQPVLLPNPREFELLFICHAF